MTGLEKLSRRMLSLERGSVISQDDYATFKTLLTLVEDASVVVDNWERGDLAGAVHCMDETLEFLK